MNVLDIMELLFYGQSANKIVDIAVDVVGACSVREEGNNTTVSWYDSVFDLRINALCKNDICYAVEFSAA